MCADIHKTFHSAWDIPSQVYNKYRRDCYPKPQNCCSRLRVKGQQLLLGKYVLVVVVALCILDCCLVITELILDIHAIKDEIKASKYGPSEYYNSHGTTTALVTDLNGNIQVTPRPPDATHVVHKRASGPDVPLSLKIAHGCHFASVAILGVLLVYVLLKVVFFGKEMFQKKIEMFDAFVVLASFALDLAFLDGLTNGPIEETAFILSFFVPWRVLRVVNSLVVAILEHEHYKLVLVYKSKKRVELTLDEVREDLHESTTCVNRLKELAIQNGVDEWKVNVCVAGARRNDGKKHALSSFAAFTFGAMAGGKKGPTQNSVKKNIYLPKLEPSTTLPNGPTSTSNQNGPTSTNIPNGYKPTSFPNGDKPLSIPQEVPEDTTEKDDVIETVEPTELVTTFGSNNDRKISVSTIATADPVGRASGGSHHGKHVTVLKIDGDDRKDPDGKTDHIAIHIAISTQDSTKCLITTEESGESSIGIDNPVFTVDNHDMTHL